MTARRVAVTIIVVFLATVAFLVYGNRDTPAKVAAEERDILVVTRAIFKQDYALSPSDRGLDRLPEPRTAHVSGSDATITTAGPIDAGSLQYAEAWYQIYHKYHRGGGTVHLHVMWNSGSLTQRFPLSEF